MSGPPLGKKASVARAFIDHAASFADLIAFILPRTFEKPAFYDKLDRRLHLLAEHELDADFFGAPYSVPTVFQLWERRAALRPVQPRTLSHPHFDFVAAGRAHFAFQRVGARGARFGRGAREVPATHYFLRARLTKITLIERLASIDWTPIKHGTAGNPSIGKGELIAEYAARYE